MVALLMLVQQITLDSLATYITGDSLTFARILQMTFFVVDSHQFATFIWALDHSIAALAVDVPEKVTIRQICAPTVIRTCKLGFFELLQYKGIRWLDTR